MRSWLLLAASSV